MKGFAVTEKEVGQTATIVELNTKKASRASERKWTKPVMNLGFTILPSLIFRAQARLGLNATQLAVLLHLADFWWDQGRKPYPRLKTLAERLNLSTRQVARVIESLKTAGFVETEERTAAGYGRMSNFYDLSGLVAKLTKLEPEFREADEMKRKVSSKGGLLKKAAA